jgi:hypothetical protein
MPGGIGAPRTNHQRVQESVGSSEMYTYAQGQFGGSNLNWGLFCTGTGGCRNAILRAVMVDWRDEGAGERTEVGGVERWRWLGLLSRRPKGR